MIAHLSLSPRINDRGKSLGVNKPPTVNLFIVIVLQTLIETLTQIQTVTSSSTLYLTMLIVGVLISSTMCLFCTCQGKDGLGFEVNYHRNLDERKNLGGYDCRIFDSAFFFFMLASVH